MTLVLLKIIKIKIQVGALYYGPMLLGNNDGAMIESPSINQITPQMIDYWEKRIRN